MREVEYSREYIHWLRKRFPELVEYTENEIIKLLEINRKRVSVQDTDKNEKISYEEDFLMWYCEYIENFLESLRKDPQKIDFDKIKNFLLILETAKQLGIETSPYENEAIEINEKFLQNSNFDYSQKLDELITSNADIYTNFNWTETLNLNKILKHLDIIWEHINVDDKFNITKIPDSKVQLYQKTISQILQRKINFLLNSFFYVSVETLEMLEEDIDYDFEFAKYVWVDINKKIKQITFISRLIELRRGNQSFRNFNILSLYEELALLKYNWVDVSNLEKLVEKIEKNIQLENN